MKKFIFLDLLKLMLFIAFIIVAVIITTSNSEIVYRPENYSGTCGDDLTWTFDEDTGVLDIKGIGEMSDFGFHSNAAPWYKFRSEIQKLIIGGNVTSIGAYAFRYCDRLTSITLPGSVTSIGEGAFYDCTGLTSVTLSEKITSIGNGAFYNCSGITSIIIPDSVTSISNYVFYNWIDSQTIYCCAESKPSEWDSDWIFNCNAKIIWGYVSDNVDVA